MREITIAYDWPLDESSTRAEKDRAFAELGWRVCEFGGGMSNVHRCFLGVCSETNELDHATLVATLAALGVPLTDEPYTGTHITGDVAVPCLAVDWPVSAQAAQGTLVRVRPLELLPPADWFDSGADGFLLTAALRFELVPLWGAPPARLHISADARGAGGTGSGSECLLEVGSAQPFECELKFGRTPPAEVDVSFRVLDVHMLLIDREHNLASVAPVTEARAFLDAQHPPAPVIPPESQEMVRRELDRLLTEWRDRPIDHEAIVREMQEQRGRVARMMAWLDMCPVPERGEGPTP